MDINKLKKSSDLALLLGMFAGDGCLSIKRNGAGFRIYPISFYNTDKKQIDLFHGLFLKLFGIDGKIRSRERKNRKVLWEFEKYSVKLYKIFNCDFEIPCGKKAPKVRVPSFIMESGECLKKYFFLGLLLTDGGIRKDKTIIFHSASENLINDLRDLIKLVWGFDKKVRKYIQKGKFISFQLTLNRKESSNILSELPTSHNPVLR